MRLGDAPDGRRAVNADAPGADVEAICAAESSARDLLSKAAEQFSLTARAFHRVMKVARTIADLDGARAVARVHMAEALTYRWRPGEVASGKAASRLASPGSGPVSGRQRS